MSIEELVRDLTKTMPMPLAKSLVREKLLEFEKKTKEDEQNRIWAYVEEYCEEHLSDNAGFYHYPTVIKDLSKIIFDKTLIKNE